MKNRDNQYEMLGYKVVGFDSIQCIPPGAYCNITISPQLPFKGERIIIPPLAAPFFQIKDIKVGQNCQTIAGDYPIHTEIFHIKEALPNLKHGVIIDAENNQRGERFDMDICLVGYNITLEVINLDVGMRRFMGAIAGRECRIIVK